jgi:hypothetical protein
MTACARFSEHGSFHIAMACSDATESATTTATLRLALGSDRWPHGPGPAVWYVADHKDTGNPDSRVSPKRSKYRQEVFNTVSFPVASRSMTGGAYWDAGDGETPGTLPPTLLQGGLCPSLPSPEQRRNALHPGVQMATPWPAVSARRVHRCRSHGGDHSDHRRQFPSAAAALCPDRMDSADCGVKALGAPAMDGASSSRASVRWPCCCQSRARRIAARSSRDVAC